MCASAAGTAAGHNGEQRETTGNGRGPAGRRECTHHDTGRSALAHRQRGWRRSLVAGPATTYPGYGPTYGSYEPAYDVSRGYVYGYAPVSGAPVVYGYAQDFGYSPVDGIQWGYATPYSEIHLVRGLMRPVRRVRAIVVRG